MDTADTTLQAPARSAGVELPLTDIRTALRRPVKA